MDAYRLTYGIVSLLNDLFGKGKEPFWQQAYTKLVKFIILLQEVLYDYVTLFDVYECAINPDLLEKRSRKAIRSSPPRSSTVAASFDDDQHPRRKPSLEGQAEGRSVSTSRTGNSTSPLSLLTNFSERRSRRQASAAPRMTGAPLIALRAVLGTFPNMRKREAKRKPASGIGRRLLGGDFSTGQAGNFQPALTQGQHQAELNSQ
jgi:hypothetical protein